MNKTKLQTLITGAVATLETALELMNVEDNTADTKDTKVVKGAGKGKGKGKVKDPEPEDEEEAGDDGDRRAELEEMSYNDLKALVSSLGGKAIGKKPAIIELILEMEADGAGEEDPEEEGEGEGEELSEEDMREQLEGFELDELKDIAKEMKVTVKSRATKKAIIELLVKDLEKLDETLEAMGYYAEEGEDEEEGEEEGEEEQTLAESLAELEQSELADICSEYSLSVKGKKQALIDRIVEAVEAGDIDEADLFSDEEGEEAGEEEGEEEEGVDVEEVVNELELADVKAVAKELKITVKKADKKPALVKSILAKDEDDIYNALVNLELIDSEEEGEEEEEGEPEVEVSAKVKKAEDKVEADIRAKIKGKKLTDNTIKKFLSGYYDGDPDCSDCSGCSKEERIDCYVKIQRSLVDDECELHKENEYYVRGELDFCCGKPLVEGKKKGTLVCEVCGEEYEIEE